MIKRVLFVCACALVAYPATAGTIVTWEGVGQIDSVGAMHGGIAIPPVGTPLTVTLSFDPSAISPSYGALPSQGNCVMTPVSASMTIGPYAYSTAPGSMGFTHAQLPGSNCVVNVGGFTQFSLHTMQSPPDTPWPIGFGGILILSYRDLLIQDAFSPTPPPGALLFLADPAGTSTWRFNGSVSFDPIDEMSPVPEPGTLALLGLGLAATFRKVRGRRAV